MEKVTSFDIKKALTYYHQKDFFITECKNGSTYFPPDQGLLKFDGLAIKRSYTGPCITGYEIKISRSDFLQDAKWHLYLQYCNEFYFVVPASLITKEELPDNVGLIYFNPETGALRKKKKALYRKIEEPVGVYKYIIFSRLEQERLPFYEDRAEYARDYLADKREKRKLGYDFGTKVTKDLMDAQHRLKMLEHTEDQVKLLEDIKKVMQKHDVGRFYWKDNDVLKDLDEALRSNYPKDLDMVKRNLETALNQLKSIEQECSGKTNDTETEA